jgi:hypothetical protein
MSAGITLLGVYVAKVKVGVKVKKKPKGGKCK